MDEDIIHSDSPSDIWRRRIGMIAGPLLGLLTYVLIPDGALSVQAHRLAAILVFTITYWICEPIPVAATALMSPLLCVLFGVVVGKGSDDPTKIILRSFASPIIFLFIGTFILARAAQKHGLDKRLALTLLAVRGVARSPVTLLATIGLASGLLSMWMSNAATTALIMPVVLGVMRANPQLADPRVAASLLLMISFGASAGGLATPIGTPPNLIAIGFIGELTGVHVSFLHWMKVGVPLAVILVVVLVVLLKPRGHGAFGDSHQLTTNFRTELHRLGPISRGEWNVILVFLTALACWLVPGLIEMAVGGESGVVKWFNVHLPEEMIGLASGLVLFLLPINVRQWEFTVHWRDAEQIDWGTILLFGGGLALGQQIFATGLATTMGDAMVGALGQPGLWSLMAAGIVLSIVLSEFTSNTASANVMVPLMIGMATTAHLDPVRIGIATCLACSFGFMLPVSTAPNAIVYGTGRVPLKKMILLGVAFDVIGGLVIWIIMRMMG